MFVDASAIIAILTDEADATLLAEALHAACEPVTSPIAIYEATLGLCRKRHISIEHAHHHITAFLALFNIQTLPITGADAEIALVAFQKYGKGCGHPAQLNMGDCFAYAAAKNGGRDLLFKGDDFSRTDISDAARKNVLF